MSLSSPQERSIVAICAADEASSKWFTHTRAPCATNERAMARPMPVAAPVMMATLLERSWGVVEAMVWWKVVDGLVAGWI